MSKESTPLMQQYREIKARHQNALLFFRMGEFYEMFYDDAEVAARALGLTLTSRNNGGASDVPLAGVPVKAAGDYLRRLIQQGFRVAICEQTEDPKVAKGIVKREVIETITPGAAYADDMLDGARNNFLCAINKIGDNVGIAAADVSTGEFRLVISSNDDLNAMLSRLSPREIIVKELQDLPEGTLITQRDSWEFDTELAREELTRQFNVLSLEGFGISADDAAAVGAAGALLRYLRELQPSGLPHLARPRVERPGGVMPLDEMTRRNLELVESLRNMNGSTEGTLLSVLDRTLTPMGARLLRQWILSPLKEKSKIESRLSAVAALAGNPIARSNLRDALDGVRDIERLGGKAAAGRATPRELRALGDSLARLPEVEAAVRNVGKSGENDTGALETAMRQWDSCGDASEEIIRTLVDRPPMLIGEEESIRPGFCEKLDELRSLRDGGKDGIARIQAQERERTGIASLKVGYNKVFGYYIEVTHTHSNLVPSDYQRRQTLTGAERYITPALKEFEEKVINAAVQIEARERELFEQLRRKIGAQIARLQCVSRVIAGLDVLASFAEVAESESYVRPVITESYDLDIKAGRHPVVERMMAREKFIPNDVKLIEDGRMIILTGPNMAGKSTILRQIGLIVLMAQIGSFVPASAATIGIVDRLFTRVGASDNLVRGQSTFMVEMSETSAILHTATRNSLVLLDEIGRGTSTYDGVSIAWSVSEHIHNEIGCKTVFATHYHELTKLSDELPAVRNYNVRVREVGDQVIFMHKLEPGGADRSYGIEVGRLAGLPAPVLTRARELLTLLEGEGERIVPSLKRGQDKGQPDLFTAAAQAGPEAGAGATTGRATPRATSDPPVPSPTHPLVDKLRDVDPNNLTPLQALEYLNRLSQEAKA